MTVTLLQGDCIEVLKTLPPYYETSVLWYNADMTDKLGRIQKGEHLSPKTQFKKGEHWRPEQPFRQKDFLIAEYANKKRSCGDIAKDFGVTEAAILFLLRKHNIPRRSVSEVRAEKHWGLAGEKNGMFGKFGEKSPNWKGGATPERQAVYSSIEWARVSLSIWKRDRGLCKRCGEQGKHIHHIISFAIKEYRTDPNNLVLLCVKCHRWVHSKKNINGEFIKEGGI